MQKSENKSCACNRQVYFNGMNMNIDELRKSLMHAENVAKTALCQRKCKAALADIKRADTLLAKAEARLHWARCYEDIPNATEETVVVNKALLRHVLAGAFQHHSPGCDYERFRLANRTLPCGHPAWKSAPACNCYQNAARTIIRESL